LRKSHARHRKYELAQALRAGKNGLPHAQHVYRQLGKKNSNKEFKHG